MPKYTIIVKQGFATVKELLDPNLPEDHSDQYGVAIFQGECNASALGHAMFHLSCIEDLTAGVRLDITQDE